MGIKFNDQHIPDSPHKVYISPAMGDAHKLEVAQFPESGVQPDKPYTFLVRKNGAKGDLFAKVMYRPFLTLVTSVLRREEERGERLCTRLAINILAKERRSAVNNSRALVKRTLPQQTA